MKTIKGLLCCVMICLSVNCVWASVTANSFIFPVKNDLISDVTMNMVDPLSNGGGWYVNNDFGTNWNETFSGTSPGGVNYPYHPGIDYNRYDGNEDSGNDVPVYSIADGTVIRVKDMGSLGWAILIRYDLQATENLSEYIIPGTITNTNIQNASSVVAMYLHLYDNTLGFTQDSDRPPIPTLTVVKGQLLGHIRSDLGHLHFEIRAGSSDQTADPDSTVQVGGYYNSSQAITNFGYIDPEKFINGQFYIGRYSDGFHTDGTSQAFVDAYNEAGGVSVLGIPWDNGGTIFVHNYPDENSNEAILIQDLLFTDSLNNVFWNLLVYNDDLEEVFPLTGQILDFWWENSGYNTYGPPTEAAHSETDVNNNAIIVQGFQSGQYIGYCETAQFVGEVFFENGEYTQSIVTPQIDNIMSMTTVSSYVCSGVDAYAYLGSSPDTDQPVVSIVNPLNSSEMKNIIFLNSNARAKYFTILSDMNGNGFPEIHLTAYDVTNLGKLVEIRDSKTGAIIQ